MKINSPINQTCLDKNFLTTSNNTNNKGFSNILTQKIQALSEDEKKVSAMKVDYANGKRDDIQNILIEGEKFNMKMSFAIQVRNKLVDAFQEVSRIQV